MKSPRWDPVKSMYYDEKYPEWYNPTDWNNNGLTPFKGYELTEREKQEEAWQLTLRGLEAQRDAARKHGLHLP